MNHVRTTPDTPDVVCFDLDGTVCDTAHRRGLRPERWTDLSAWRPYHMACAEDVAVEGIATVLRILGASNRMHAVSGRHTEARDLTLDWFNRHNIPCDELRLYDLATDAPTPNEQYKASYVSALRQRGLTPVLFVEDLPRAADYLEQHANVPILRVVSHEGL